MAAILPASCRCCLMEDKDMVYVFDILDEFDMQISDLIARNGAIVIQESDAFSKHICGNCLNDLAIAERFVLRCRKTNDLLMNIAITSDELEEGIDTQDHGEALLVKGETLEHAANEPIAYVLVSAETETEETIATEEETVSVGLDQFTGNHTQHVGSLQKQDSLLQLQDQEFEPDDERMVETIPNHPIYEDGMLNGDGTIESTFEMGDGLYDGMFEDSSLNVIDEELNRLMDDANHGKSDEEEQGRVDLTSTKIFDFKFSCSQCGANFVTCKNYARHLKSHNILACEKCLELFKSLKLLKSHEPLCTRDDNTPIEGGQDCLAAVTSPNATQQKKPHVCSYCNKRWISQSALTIHLRSHTGERPFGCRFCDKRFKTVAAMDLHERRHSGIKPYSCTICDKRFAEGSNLKVHMMMHTKEKSHVCTVCNRAFARVFLLQLHMRTHTGEKPYECETCGRKFAQQCDLTAHRRLHSGERPYACNVCGKCFTKSSALAQHRKSHQKQMMHQADDALTD